MRDGGVSAGPVCECGNDTHQITAWVEDAAGELAGTVLRCLGCERVFTVDNDGEQHG